jgi:hypothetical protein
MYCTVVKSYNMRGVPDGKIVWGYWYVGEGLYKAFHADLPPDRSALPVCYGGIVVCGLFLLLPRDPNATRNYDIHTYYDHGEPSPFSRRMPNRQRRTALTHLSVLARTYT